MENSNFTLDDSMIELVKNMRPEDFEKMKDVMSESRLSESDLSLIISARGLGKTETQNTIMRNYFYHDVCKQIQDWKEKIHEMEIKTDEVPVDDGFLEKLKNLKENAQRRIDHLNRTNESWQIEILKQYGIYTKNRD